LSFDLLNVRVWVAGEGESARLKKELNQEKGGDREEGLIKKR
jgi:NADPH-dependent ferric siderophore reductase